MGYNQYNNILLNSVLHAYTCSIQQFFNSGQITKLALFSPHDDVPDILKLLQIGLLSRRCQTLDHDSSDFFVAVQYQVQRCQLIINRGSHDENEAPHLIMWHHFSSKPGNLHQDELQLFSKTLQPSTVLWLLASNHAANQTLLVLGKPICSTSSTADDPGFLLGYDLHPISNHYYMRYSAGKHRMMTI